MHGLPVVLVNSAEGLVFVAGAVILSRDDNDDDNPGGKLNMQAVLLDTTADAAAATTVALAVSGVIAYQAIKLLHGLIATLRS